MPTSGVRLRSRRYALREDRTAHEADGVRLRWRGRHAQGAFERT